jgi:hypothetical protein
MPKIKKRTARSTLNVDVVVGASSSAVAQAGGKKRKLAGPRKTGGSADYEHTEKPSADSKPDRDGYQCLQSVGRLAASEQRCWVGYADGD